MKAQLSKYPFSSIFKYLLLALLVWGVNKGWHTAEYLFPQNTPSDFNKVTVIRPAIPLYGAHPFIHLWGTEKVETETEKDSKEDAGNEELFYVARLGNASHLALNLRSIVLQIIPHSPLFISYHNLRL